MAKARARQGDRLRTLTHQPATSSEGRRILARMSRDLDVYLAHQRAVQLVHGIVIRYRLALDGPTVKTTHSDLDATLPARSILITTDQGELLIRSAEWVDRVDDLAAHVLGWLMAHIDLRAATTRTGARRYDEVWMTAWRQANPGGRRT